MLCFDFFITLLLRFEKRSVWILSFPELIPPLYSAFSPAELPTFFETDVPVDSDDPVVQFGLGKTVDCNFGCVMSVESKFIIRIYLGLHYETEADRSPLISVYPHFYHVNFTALGEQFE